MAKLLVNGFQMHCQQLGSGPPLVMVHGMTGNLAIWHMAIAPALAPSYHVTTYDLRGHGYSDAPPTGYSTADHANDLKHLLDVLGIEKAPIMGHSFGADIALHFAILFPERVERLILVEPAISALTFLRKQHDWIGWKYWREKLASGGVAVPEEHWYDPEYLVRLSVGLPMVFGFRKGQARRAAPTLRLLNNTTAAKDYSDAAGMTLEKIKQVPHPVLVLYGEDSVFLGTYEYLRDNLPNARCLLMSDSEHFGPIERPDLLLRHLKLFLNDSAEQPLERELRISTGGSAEKAAAAMERTAS
jgi:pimeloyl-ACP methyl ester carboxylesterase